MKPNILVMLPSNRTSPGTLLFTSPDGTRTPFACYGKSDNAAAAAHGNPERNPLMPFGDIPTGRYTGQETIAGTPARTYGPHRRILLIGIEGDAKIAFSTTGKDGVKKPARWGIMIHGGEPAKTGGFRPTHGCLRVSDETMKILVDAIADDGTIDVEIINI